MDKYIDQYFGPLQIKEIKLSKEKTYSGKKKVDIVFANQEKRTIPLDILESGITKDISDLTNLQRAICRPVVLSVLAIFMDSELKMEDLQYICNSEIPMMIADSRERADEKLWGKKLYNINLMDINKILVQNGTTEKE